MDAPDRRDAGRLFARCSSGTWLVTWKLVCTNQAKKDAKKILQSGLRPQAEQLLEVLKADPYWNPPPYEKLVRDLSGAYSRRVNIQHRMVYQVFDDLKTVKIIRMWTHYR
ncbi:MAG: Txe/YoeB family addiction module toxin [Chloroflexi bacterium]|nr:Txe/YoeB family addiction module toxin [Chloroflexota bacterium]